MKLWIGILLVLALAGCTAGDREESLNEIVPEATNPQVPQVNEISPTDEPTPASEIMEETDMKNVTGVTMSAEASVQEDFLTISYQVHNILEQPIYLVNRVFRWSDAGFSVDPAIVYTQLSDGELWLTKAKLDVPENFDVEDPDVPFLTKVEAGEIFEESFSLPIPLEPFHAYPQVRRAEEAASFDQLKLVIGWLPGEAVTTRTTTRPDGLTLTSADHMEVSDAQMLLFANLGVTVPAHIEKP